MRARNLKPGTFKNEILGTADPLLTILFEGLWCMADRAGRLEDRPLRICAEIFPYRRKISEKRADEMLWWLDENGFIARYQIGAEQFIQVLEFGAHQNPHKDERQSIIQAFTPDLHRARTVPTQKLHRRKAEVVGLIPSSLTPDSPIPDPLTHRNPVPAPCERVEHERWRDVETCDQVAYRTWLDWRESENDTVPARVRIQDAKFLGGKGTPAQQREFIDKLIRLRFKRLHEPIEHRSSGAQSGHAKPTAEHEALQFRELKDGRAHRGLGDFRDPLPGETPEAYRTALRTEENRRGGKLGEPRFPLPAAGKR